MLSAKDELEQAQSLYAIDTDHLAALRARKNYVTELRARLKITVADSSLQSPAAMWEAINRTIQGSLEASSSAQDLLSTISRKANLAAHAHADLVEQNRQRQQEWQKMTDQERNAKFASMEIC
jgi:hypothetical protein